MRDSCLIDFPVPFSNASKSGWKLSKLYWYVVRLRIALCNSETPTDTLRIFSSVGPGLVYIGIHGGRFLELSNSFFGHRSGFLGSHAELPAEHLQCQEEVGEAAPLYCETAKAGVLMSYGITDSWVTRQIKSILWFLLGMPVWCAIAAIGKESLTFHVTNMALRSPHPIRIGNVRFARTKLTGGDTRIVIMNDGNSDTRHGEGQFDVSTKLLRADSLPKNHATLRMSDGMIMALPCLKAKQKGVLTMSKDPEGDSYKSINQRIGAVAKRQIQEDKLAIEDDPQQDPPSTADFVIAIFYVVFGVVAMVAGLLSIFL
jgi:hypothetical protein